MKTIELNDQQIDFLLDSINAVCLLPGIDQTTIAIAQGIITKLNEE